MKEEVKDFLEQMSLHIWWNRIFGIEPSAISSWKGGDETMPRDEESPMDEPIEDLWRNRAMGMRCRTCIYWVRKLRERPTEVGHNDLGRCRRRSPAINGWPAVFEMDWCGDHKLDENKC